MTYDPNTKNIPEMQESIEKLQKETRGVKISNWVTAVSTSLLALVALVTFVYTFIL